MRATSDQSVGELVTQSSGGYERDGGVPRPPYSMDYAPYPETFGARIFRRLAETNEANVQCAGRIVELREDLGNVVDDINALW